MGESAAAWCRRFPWCSTTSTASRPINDLYGHQAGDECLQRVAACALDEIGAEDDVAARYGGEEFMLLLPRTPLEEARRVAERLRAAVAALRIPHAGGEELGVVTASFGVASADIRARSFPDADRGGRRGALSRQARRAQPRARRRAGLAEGAESGLSACARARCAGMFARGGLA